jgi:hemin uptake protein HemP
MNSRLRKPPLDTSPLKPGTTVVGPSVLGLARLSNHAIVAGANEVEIEHNGVLYRLAVATEQQSTTRK